MWEQLFELILKFKQNRQMMFDLIEIKYILDEAHNKYNNIDFVETDPIQIPHRFSKKEDIEIAGFLTATIAWGQRKSIIKNANRLMSFMDDSPYDFLMNGNLETDWQAVRKFVHRTFNADDCMDFMKALKHIYKNKGGLENVMTEGFNKDKTIFSVLNHFRSVFFEIEHNAHTQKHISNVSSNSSAKRLNMFLRWMIRKDDKEVDFGLWEGIPMSALMLPLDVHTADVGRALGILTRKQNDWKAVVEITDVLRKLDVTDPIKYDFSLFGIGAFAGKAEFGL